MDRWGATPLLDAFRAVGEGELTALLEEKGGKVLDAKGRELADLRDSILFMQVRT
jgi:hypothetical protein